MRHRVRPIVLFGFIFGMLATLPAYAQLKTSTYVSGLTLPVGFVQDPSDGSVQYVVEQGGRIRVIVNGTLQTTDFLDLSGSISSGGERGLLGLAFAPDYATSRRFYVNFTNLAGDTVVARFLRSTSNPLTADESTRFDFRWPGGARVITQPFANHNGGHLVFGPDGYLYIGMGDGGSGNDPDHRAQNPDSLLGKMLRIDVNVPDSDPDGYDVPADNPFLDGVPVPALGEIWAFGLRNPWQFSFDDPAHGGSGAMLIGDVGQSTLEEIDYQPPARGGRNYGWRNREGTLDNVTTLPPAYLPLIDPIITFDRANANAITGGVVYRGTRLGAEYQGRYFFGDFIARRVWSIALAINPATGEATASDLREHTSELGGTDTLSEISAFGVDADGELFIVAYGLGRILRVERTMGVSDPLMAIDQPSNGSAVAGAFTVSGWALDRGASSGTGVDAVHVYAYPSSRAAPIFLGGAVLGDARPDIASRFGAAFLTSGFHLTAAGLAPGGYRVVAYARSTVAAAFSIARIADVTVGSGALMAIDIPLAGAIAQPVVLAGWALDLNAVSGSGVDAIHVYAYPNPGSGAPPLFLGLARYGDPRPDVGQAFGGAFATSGFAFTISGLAAGTYQLVAFAHSTVSNTFEARAVVVTIASGERMAVDLPTVAASVGTPFIVAGWAIDAAAPSGTGVDLVHVWAYPASGPPVFLGAATYGGLRPDVGAIFGSQFQTSAYGLAVSTLAPGTYTLVVYAHSTVTGGFTNAASRIVRVQ